MTANQMKDHNEEEVLEVDELWMKTHKVRNHNLNRLLEEFKDEQRLHKVNLAPRVKMKVT